MKARGFTPVWGAADTYEKFMKKNSDEIGEVMQALGLRS